MATTGASNLGTTLQGTTTSGMGASAGAVQFGKLEHLSKSVTYVPTMYTIEN
jgi:hypothetical protein